MNKNLSYLFKAIYIGTIIAGSYVLYHFYQMGLVYRGDFPEWGREKLDLYSSHSLMALLNFIKASLGLFVLTFFCLWGVSKDLESQPLSINLLFLSYILSADWVIITAWEWVDTPPVPWRLEGLRA